MCSLSSFMTEWLYEVFAYHAHGTAYGDKFCRCPWLVWHDINSAMHCSLRLAPTMINHLTSLIISIRPHFPIISADVVDTSQQLMSCDKNFEAESTHFTGRVLNTSVDEFRLSLFQQHEQVSRTTLISLTIATPPQLRNFL